ncbi:MAG: DnaJ C-terminal domain-containing protein [Rhodospirillales bacterium]
MKDAYKILGVTKTATSDQIKSAYRKAARERHPDLDPGNPWAEDDFKELTAAYEVLSNAERRRQYDDGDIDATGQPRARTRTSGYDAKGKAKTKRWKKDPFETFRQRKRQEKSVKVDGANVNYSLKLSAVDAKQGGTKYISMTNGKRLKVGIPKNTLDGQVLRLKGQGMPGLGGGNPGDALVVVTVETDSRFRIEGRDVHVEVAVDLAEAVLGGKVKAPILNGEVSVTVPENSNTGTVLRLKGKGLKDGDGDEPGDQYVTLKVMLPKKPDPELRAFIKEWAKTTGAKAS